MILKKRSPFFLSVLLLLLFFPLSAQDAEIDFEDIYREKLANDPQLLRIQAEQDYYLSYMKDPLWNRLADFSAAEKWAPHWVQDFREGLSLDSAVLPGHPELGEDAISGQSLGLAIRAEIPGEYQLDLNPALSIKLPAGLERLNLWVQGENQPHQLYMILEDAEGREMPLLLLGKTHFMGWKMMECRLPEEWIGKAYLLKGIRIEYDPLSLSPKADLLYFNTLGGYPWEL